MDERSSLQRASSSSFLMAASFSAVGQGPQHRGHTIHLRSFDLMMEDVSLAVRPTRFWRRCKPSLLSHVNAFMPAGSITCVLVLQQSHGSAFLSTLVGIEGKADGLVLANELPTNCSAFHAHVAFISTVKGIDVESTVETNLLFSTQMRVTMEGPASRGGEEDEVRRRVHHAAEMTLLTRFLPSRVKDLTAAQLYQLAIAMETVRNPTVFLLDAPLQSFSVAETQTFVAVLSNLMNESSCLHLSPSGADEPRASESRDDGAAPRCASARSEVRQRRVVVLSATEVPLALYAAITHLVMLSSEGSVLYSGEKEGIEAFFDRDVGVPNVQGEMIGDLLAQMEDAGSTGEMADKFTHSAAHQRLRENIRRHKDRVAADVFTNATLLRAEALRVDKRNGDLGDGPDGVTYMESVAAVAPSYPERLRLLTVFTLRKHFLNLSLVIPWVCLLAVFVVMFLVLALAGYSVGNEVQNRAGVIFFLLSCSLLLNSVFFDTEVEEFSTFVHMRNNSYFSVSQYIITTALRLLLPRLIVALLTACCSLLILRAASLPLIIVLLLTSLSHAHLSMLLLYWMPTQAAVVRLSHAQYWYYGYCVIFSGFLISLVQIPAVLQYLSLLRIGFGGLFATEVRNSRFGCEDDDSQTSSSSTHVPSSHDVVGSLASLALVSSQGSFSDSAAVKLPCFSGQLYLAQRGLASDGWGQATVVLLLTALALFALLAVSMHVTWAPRRL